MFTLPKQWFLTGRERESYRCFTSVDVSSVRIMDEAWRGLRPRNKVALGALREDWNSPCSESQNANRYIHRALISPVRFRFVLDSRLSLTTCFIRPRINPENYNYHIFSHWLQFLFFFYKRDAMYSFVKMSRVKTTGFANVRICV